MDPARPASDAAIVPAEAVRLAVHADAIRTGPSPRAITPAAPPPQLSDDEVRELVEDITQPFAHPFSPGFFDCVEKGGLLGGGSLAAFTLICGLMIILGQPTNIDAWALSSFFALAAAVMAAIFGFFIGAAVGAMYWLLGWALFGK